MEPQLRGKDWRSILLLIFSLSGMVLVISGAVATLVFWSIDERGTPVPLPTLLTASTFIAVGLLLVPVAWLSMKRLRGWEFEKFSLPAPGNWTWVVLPGVWLLVIVLASLFRNGPGASFFAPFLHFISIALPIYLLIRIFINRIPLGSSQRAWGVFASGLTLSPFLAVIAEGVIIVLGLFGVGVYMVFNPEKMFKFERLIQQIEQAPDMESLVYLAGPLVKNPLTLITALGFLSVFVPVIEEIFKSIGVWLVFDRISTTAQGFALGVLSGAGFALSESMFASVTADEAWAVTISARAISSAMHMLATGLVGWGIAFARLEKRILRLFGMTLLAILLHSIWNAGAVFSVAGGVGIMLTMPDFDFLSTFLMLAGIGLILALTFGMFVAMFMLNKLLSPPLQQPLSPVELEETPGDPSHQEHTGNGGVK